jgi:hypothetical protein
MSIEQGYPGKINHDDGRREPVPSDTIDDAVIDSDPTVVEPDSFPPREVPTPRTPEEDYVVPDRRRGLSRGKAILALGTVVVAAAAAAAVYISSGGNDEPKNPSAAPDFGNAPSTSAAPLETGNSQPPIAETTSTTPETSSSEVVEIPTPANLKDSVFLGDKMVPTAEAEGKMAIRGANATEASASVRGLMGNLMSGLTHPNQLYYSTGGNPTAAKDQLVTKINEGILGGVLEEGANAQVDSMNAPLGPNFSMADIIVAQHDANIDANKVAENVYSGGTISEVDLAGAEEIVQQGEYTVVKAEWAVNDYDRSGPNSTKGETAVDTDSYTVSMFLRPGAEPGTWTIAKFAATKAKN